MARPKTKGKKAVGKPAAAAATGNSKKAARGASAKQKRSAATSKSVSKDVYSDDDDDEQEERMNAKMDIDGVYEYEQPETFEHDSEIDEDEAFNSEDEQSYGSFFSSTSKASSSKKKQSAASDDDDNETVEDDDDEDDDAAAGGDLLSDLLGTAPAKRLSTKDDGEADDADDSALENSDDEDDEPKNLSSLADGLVPERKKKKLEEINMDGAGASISGASAGGELTLSSLLGAGSSSSGDAPDSTLDATDGLNLSKVKKQVRDLETDGSAALKAAIAPIHEERATRKIAYAEKKQDVDLFQTVVRRNRQKETMDFREQTPKIENLTAASLTSKFSAQTSMEKEVEALLKAGDLSDRAIAKDEQDELAAKKVSQAEVLQRQQELAKMRALMFYEEQKQKRIKKIKSKLYHKIRNGQDKKAAEKQRKQLRELDPELADQLDQEMAEKRAEERMTLKHTNTSKWVKHQLKRGTLADNETRGAIAEQLRRGEELRRKVRTAHSDDEDDDDDDDSGDEHVDAVTRLQKRLEKQADALVMEITNDEASASQAKGLQGMKFMQRAVQKQREKARSEAEKLLRELKGDDGGLLSDGDAASSDDESAKPADATADGAGSKKKNRKKNKKSVVVTAEDKEAVAKALPKGALQTGTVSMDKGLSARSSGAVAVDLGDGTSAKTLGVDTSASASGKTIELGAKAKAAAAAAKSSKAAAASDAPATETEENPWLSGASASTKNKKRNKKAASKKGQSGADVASAIESLSKSVAKDADVASATSVNALSVLTGGGASKNSKKRKLEQTSGSTSESADAPVAVADSAKSAKKAKAVAPVRDANGKLTQEELVRRAFAFADDGDDEIAREKELIASQDTNAKKGAEIAKLVGMTGWGSWAGDGVKVSFRQKAREVQAQKLASETKKQVLASRKDAKMDRVLINEKKDKRAAKFTVQDVPYPFTSREEYEMAMRNPLGSDWNTPASTSALTVPKVIKRAGTIINPLALSKADKKEAKKELSKQRKAKF